MAKITRYDGNVEAFASNATGLNRTIFGDVTQSDDLDDNLNADFKTGWEIVGIADAPSKQDFNALGFTTTQLISYIYQMGTPEWNDGQEYHSDSTCSYGGKLYISLTDGNVANTPSSSPSNWTPLATESDFGDYYTGTELDTGQLDSRYYTETELDAGQLDNRYYTETELDAALALKSDTTHVHAGEDITSGSISIGVGEDIILANSANIQGTETGLGVVDILTVDGSNTTQVGDTSIPTNINSTGDLTHNSNTIYDSGSGPMAGFRNKIINGNFDIWQRGTSFGPTASVIYAADHWKTINSGATMTVNQVAFTPGQTDVPGNPHYYLSFAATVADNLWRIEHRIEDVTTLSAKTVTFSCYLMSPDITNASILINQSYGVGGSTTELHAQAITISSLWQKFTFTTTLNSMSGKTIGADSFVGPSIRCNDNQTGTINIAQSQFEEGPVATPFEERPIQTELYLCQRYFWAGGANGDGNGYLYGLAADTDMLACGTSFPVTMRTTPAVSVVTAPTYTNCTNASLQANTDGFQHLIDVTANGKYRAVDGVYQADAEL